MNILDELKLYRQEGRTGYISYLGEGLSEYRLSEEWKKNARIALEQNRISRELSKKRVCCYSTFGSDK